MDLKGYKPVIGLEVHVQLLTKSKLFGFAPNNPDEKNPNTNIDEIATGEPGTLPLLNEKAVRLGVMVGLALNCEIPEYSKFDRKHYFYPDLPKGYQISQYDEPICVNGWIDIEVPIRDHPGSFVATPPQRGGEISTPAKEEYLRSGGGGF